MIEQALCPVLIGREEELARLEDGLLAASRGQGGVVLLAGEAGVGKTRLSTELRRRALTIGFTWLWGGCAESDLALPYIPFLEAIGNHLMAADVGALRERLGRTAEDLGQLFPQFVSGDRESSGDPGQAKIRLFEGILSLLGILAEERGLLLVLEDLHWADASTREALDYIARRIRQSKVMVLGTYRRDEMHRRHPLLPIVQGWRRVGLADVVDLDPLEAGMVEQMISAIFEREVTPDFLDLLYQRTEGNPFVLEEMLKEAIDRGDLFRTESGRWERKEISELRIPQTVADSILLRIERLDPDHAEVLRAAAVLGRSFAYATLAAVTGLDDAAVLGALRAGVQQQLIEDDPLAADRYRFRHALTRESIYEDLILPERRRLHSRAAEVLGADPSVPAVELAHHLLAADLFDQAVPVCIRAAEEAMQRFGFSEAAELYERALPYITDTVQHALITCAIGEAHWLNGENTLAQRYLKEGIPRLEAANEKEKAAHYLLGLGRAYWEANMIEDARVTYEQARDVLERFGASEDLALAYVRLAGLRAFQLDGEECVRLATRAREVAEQAGAIPVRILADVFIGMGTAYSGAYDEGLARIDAAAEEAKGIGHEVFQGNAYANACVLRYSVMGAREAVEISGHFDDSTLLVFRAGSGYFQGVAVALLGDIEGAQQRLETCRVISEEFGLTFYSVWARMWQAQLFAEQLRLDEAIAVLPSRAEVVQLQEVLWLSRATVNVHLARGEVDLAAEVAREILPHAARLRCFGYIVPVVTEALLAAGDVDLAERFVRDAVTVDQERPWIQIAQGRVAAARGDAAGAAPLLRAAADGFQAAGYRPAEMRARFDLARALATEGDMGGAKAECGRVVSLARECGSALMRQRIRESAAMWSIDLPAEAAEDEAAPPAEFEEGAAGERLVTVMFADVRGYTAMTMSEVPADLVERVSAFHRFAQREIERRRGLVDKFAGDAVMATFNVSGRTVDHALQALHAGVSLQDRAALVNLPVGVGIACGPAVVGRFAKGANVSVLGEATNLAARLQAQADAGEIVLSEGAYRRVQGWLAEHDVSVSSKTFELKGFAEPVRAFVLESDQLATIV